jgi:hypothetical protein
MMVDLTAVPEPEQREHFQMRPWRELAFYAAILMELSWISLWSRLVLRLGPRLSYPEVLATLAVIVIANFTLASLLNRLNVKVWVRRIFFIFVLFLSLWFGLVTLLDEIHMVGLWEILSRPLNSFEEMAELIPVEFVVMLLVLLLAWRAVGLVGQHVEPGNIINGFRLGIFGIVTYALFGPWNDHAPVTALLTFLFSSLLAMSASRIAILSLLRGGQAIPFDRHWLSGIVVSIFVIVMLSWLVEEAMAGQGFFLLSRIFTLLVTVVVLILSPLLWLVMQAIFWIGEWLNLGQIMGAILDMIQLLQKFVDTLVKSVTSWISTVDAQVLRRISIFFAFSRPFLIFGTIIVVLVIILLTVRRRLWKKEQVVSDQDYENLLTQKDLLDLIRDALRRGLNKLLDEFDRFGNLGRAHRWLAAARIRRIYAHLMELSERLGEARPSSMTPLEFLPRLKQLFKTQENALETITQAYLRVRYGELPETGSDVVMVEQAWGRIREIGQEQLRERRRR